MHGCLNRSYPVATASSSKLVPVNAKIPVPMWYWDSEGVYWESVSEILYSYIYMPKKLCLFAHNIKNLVQKSANTWTPVTGNAIDQGTPVTANFFNRLNALIYILCTVHPRLRLSEKYLEFLPYPAETTFPCGYTSYSYAFYLNFHFISAKCFRLIVLRIFS